MWLGLYQDAFFLQRTDSLRAEHHRNLLPVDEKRLLLQVRFKDALCATQREAHVMSVLLAFTGEFTSCCHSLFIPLQPFYTTVF